jgi:hypothetical protein
MKVELTKVKVGFWCQHSIARIEVAENPVSGNCPEATKLAAFNAMWRD